MKLAIKAGMRFDLGDFAYIAKELRWEYWTGDSEWVYALAVSEGNLSAAKCFEHHLGREPFIAGGGVELSDTHRQRDRLAVGSRFQWEGNLVTVTSFSPDQMTIIACTYKPRVPGVFVDKIDRRYRIIRKQLSDVFKAEKGK